MAQFLHGLLSASMRGSVVIVAVLFLRLVLRKTPKKFLCLMWLLVGLALLMPFEIRSDLSLQPEWETVTTVQWVEDVPVSTDTLPLPTIEDTQKETHRCHQRLCLLSQAKVKWRKAKKQTGQVRSFSSGWVLPDCSCCIRSGLMGN